MPVVLPTWPDPQSAEGMRFFGGAHAVLAAFKAHGLGDNAAIALVTMAEAESSFDPNALGDYVDAAGHRIPWMAHYPPGATPMAFGLFQHHTARCAAIKAATGIDIQGSVLAGRGDVQSQCEGAWWELTHGPGYGLAAISGAKTANDAARRATELFEKTGAPFAEIRRGAMADRWDSYFAQGA